MTRIILEVLGDKQIDRQLARFGEQVTKARPLWNELANDFARTEAEQFAREGAWSGGWAPLSPSYAAWKAKRYPGRPILTRTGRLRESLTVRPLAVERITDDSLTVGTDVPYAGYHQHGTTRMPRRRPVEFTEGHRREWVRKIQAHVVAMGAAR